MVPKALWSSRETRGASYWRGTPSTSALFLTRTLKECRSMKRAAIFTAAAAFSLSLTGAAFAQAAANDATPKPGANSPKSGQQSDIKQQESKGATVKAGPNAATGITVSGNAGAGGGGTPASQ